MKGKSILLCSSDNQLCAATSKALERCGSRVVRAADEWEAEMALAAGGLDLAIVDTATVRGSMEFLEKTNGRLLSIALTAGDDLQLLSQLVCGVGVAHVVARPDSSVDAVFELLITVSKLLSNDLFGLEKYIRGKTTTIRRTTLTCAEDRDVQLQALSTFLREHKAPRQAISTIANAADEMLTNAIYNAPVDGSGRPRYAATNRRSKVELMESEFVEFSYGIRNGVFGMSVNDSFGRLRLDHLSKSIRRCTTADNPIEQKAGGAGLGLFMLAQTAHQFIVNVSAERRTEVIALWSLDRKKLRERRSHNSLHFFEEAIPLSRIDRSSRRLLGTEAAPDAWQAPANTLPGMGCFGLSIEQRIARPLTVGGTPQLLPTQSSLRRMRRRNR